MTDATFAERMIQQAIQAKEAASTRRSFINSATFERLLAPFIDATGPVTINYLDLCYSRATAALRLGWAQESTEDIHLFFSIVSDVSGPLTDQGTVEEIHGFQVPLVVFESAGLWVCIANGSQATTTLYNEEAYAAWRPTLNVSA